MGFPWMLECGLLQGMDLQLVLAAAKGVGAAGAGP